MSSSLVNSDYSLTAPLAGDEHASDTGGGLKRQTTFIQGRKAAITIATGTLPVMGSVEGKEAIAADAFVFINFARLIVPARIAFALGLAPWCDENIIQKYFPDEKADENKE